MVSKAELERQAPGSAEAFWLRPLADLQSQLDTGPGGLSSADAARRLVAYGPNELGAQARRGLLAQLLGLLISPLNVVLLVASAVSAGLGEPVSAGIIAVMVVMGVALDFSQLYQSQRAVEALRRRVSLRANALRDGRIIEIARQEVVPGDVLLLASGDMVPADGRLLEAKDLFANESALTGESLPAEKDAVDLPADALTITDASNSLFLGTSVVSGTAKLLAVATGAATEYGRIGQHLALRPPETAFWHGTRDFALLITRTIAVLVVFVFVVNVVRSRPPLESLLFAVALAVGLTPELLPVIMSVTLARGAVRMSHKQVIVKQLEAIQSFGSMDILCSDKTGTLTQGNIVLDRHLDPAGNEDEAVLRLAYLNSYFETGIKSPLEVAILGHETIPVDGWAKVDEVPFDFTRRRLSVVVSETATSRRVLIAKGAPEGVIDACSQYRKGGAVASLDDGARAAIDAAFDKLSADGYRVLGIASRDVPAQASYDVADESGMTFEGFATFLDPPKTDAGETIAELADEGVLVRIITGDNELVTRKVCQDVGLDPGEIVLGRDLDALSDEELGVLAERTTVFARATPEQKNRIIQCLRARGHVVGFLGDGINDAPSLHAADVGISVANAVDVARESASIILLQNDLRVLRDGVQEGRKAFGNVMKYILMGTSSNFGNMFSMAGATLFLPYLPMLPFQVLLNNLLYDISQITIPGDAVDASYVRKPKHWDIAFIRRFMIVIGPISSIYDFVTFGVMIWAFDASEKLFHTGWFIESLTTQILVIYVIRTAGNPFRSRPSGLLLASTLGCLGVGVLLAFTPLGSLLDFVQPPAGFFIFLPAAALTYLALVQAVKVWFYRRYGIEG